jgi:phenylacetate-CoA ligase
MFAAILSATIKWQEKVGMYSLIAENLIYQLADLALGTSVMKYFCQLQKTQWWPVERLKEMQDVKLAELISHCHKNVPYYRDLFTRLGLRRRYSKTGRPEEFAIISKQTIRENFKKLTAHRPDRYKPIPNFHRRLNGEPLQFYIDKDVVSINWAGMFRGWEWAGYKPGDKRITFGWVIFNPGRKSIRFLCGPEHARKEFVIVSCKPD